MKWFSPAIGVLFVGILNGEAGLFNKSATVITQTALEKLTAG